MAAIAFVVTGQSDLRQSKSATAYHSKNRASHPTTRIKPMLNLPEQISQYFGNDRTPCSICKLD
jgi:hypothetical protein